MLAVLAALALAAGAERSADPCRAATAAMARPIDLPKDAGLALDAYRGAWKRACDSNDSVDVATMLGDAEVLAQDARMSRIVRTIGFGALERGQEWPFPAIRSLGEVLAVDWTAFADLGERGGADDQRFWRGAVVVANAVGEPVWVRAEPEAASGECLRLGEVSWSDIARALDGMGAAEPYPYPDRTREFRGRFLETLGAIAQGPQVCGCVRGDAAKGLAELASGEGGAKKGAPPPARDLVKAAADALSAFKSGRAKVQWLRQSPGGPATGCGGR
jgi:hypothetical protein